MCTLNPKKYLRLDAQYPLYSFPRSIRHRGDTNVPANGYRKTVSTIRGTDIQRLYRFAGIREESGQQACYTVQPVIEPAFTQHVWNQPVLTDKNDGSFSIAAKIFCGNQCDCDNFAIGYCTVLYDA
jgi:hypothetical protein